MKTTLIYIHLPHDPEHVDLAARFLSTYHANPPLYPHDTMIVCNGSAPTAHTQILFSSLNPRFLVHDDSGFDIGAYQAAAKLVETDSMFCCGGPCYFRKAGWLQRIAQAWTRYGPGMYGTLSSYEIRPHFCTSGFAVPPSFIRSYPRVVTKEERYNFEHGPTSLVYNVIGQGKPAILVTWDGEYTWPHWRTPPNIYCKGDQSNCLTYFRHSDSYDQSNHIEQQRRQRLADSYVAPQNRPGVSPRNGSQRSNVAAPGALRALV